MKTFISIATLIVGSALMLSGLVGRTVRRGTPLHDEWSSVKRIVNIAVRANPGVVAPAANPGSVAPAAHPTTDTAPAAQGQNVTRMPT